MELQEITQFIKRKWQTVVAFTLVFAALALVVSVALPQKYKAEQRLLLVQSYAEDVDPYAATRSTEYLTNLLTEVMYSEKFLTDVTQSGFGVSEDLFPELPKKRKNFWEKTLRTRVVGDTGIIEVNIYHTDQYTADQLALAVGHVLRDSHGNYHSRGNAVVIQTIDQPTVSPRPVQPNIPLASGAGAVLGFIAGLSFIYLFPRKEVFFLKNDEQYRLSPARDHDWSKPIAEPRKFYEESTIKYPRFYSGLEA